MESNPRHLSTRLAGRISHVFKIFKYFWLELGRSLADLIRMLDDFRKRGVKFRSFTEAINTETPTGRAMRQMTDVLAELERSLISERTRAGVKGVRDRGVKFGPKPKLTPQQITHAPMVIDDGQRCDSWSASGVSFFLRKSSKPSLTRE
jgi:DNA invertase Pin-like site-specific DNA recombinase